MLYKGCDLKDVLLRIGTTLLNAERSHDDYSDMFKKPDNVFITYTHPSDQKRKANKRIVSSFVSKSYRPTSRKIVFERSHYRPFLPTHDNSTPPKGSSTESPVHNVSSISQSKPAAPDAPLPLGALDSTPTTPDTRCRHGAEQPIVEGQVLSPEAQWLAGQLASRFTPALNTDHSRYEAFLAFASQNAQCYNALLAQAYYHVDSTGFSQPHWLALYHRGEAMKLLRQQMEQSSGDGFDDSEAIFIASLLLSVEHAHTDHTAWLLHKRALECMVADKGGHDKLCYQLRDEMLRNEFFLQVLVHGKVDVCDWGAGVKLRIRDYHPMDETMLCGLPPVFQALAHRMAFNAAAARFVLSFLQYLAQIGRYQPSPFPVSTHGSLYLDISISELDQILALVHSRECKYIEHQACLALLVFIFNLHHQDELSDNYLATLDDAAIDMITIKSGGPLPARKCLLWSVATIGSAAAIESPWRLHIPFMGHIIRKMARGDEHTAELRKVLHSYYLYGASPQNT